MSVDYKVLLGKYVRRVKDAEGVDFIDVGFGYPPGSPEELTEAERAELKAISRGDASTASSSGAPRRRFRLKLELEADSMDALVRSLENIGLYAERGELTKGFSAGFDSSYDYELTDDPSITPEVWREALASYIKQREEANRK